MTEENTSIPAPRPCGKKRRGMMLILAGPPASGKTTITHAILDNVKHTTISVSATTRAQRPGEVEGEHYFFMDKEKFQSMVDKQEMLEYALVYNGQLYGTPRAPVEKALAAGKDILFDIDWQGARQLQSLAPYDVVTVFLLPPNLQELEKRLRARAQDSDEEITRRMGKVHEEISHYREFQYVIINNDLEDSIQKVRSILEAERRRRHRLIELDAFVTDLVAEK